MRAGRGATALAFAMLVFAAGERSAEAWCRTTTTQTDFRPTDAQPCNPTGKPLFWASKCVGFSVQQDASVVVDLATVRALADKVFAEWSGHECPQNPTTCSGPLSGVPSIKGDQLAPVATTIVEFNRKGENANVIVFRDKAWPHDPAQLALTTVSFGEATGELYDADTEINSNPANFAITVTDPPAKIVYDLRSILTHEAGHFLGMAHAPDREATMFASYESGETKKRDLAQDDVCGICAVYAPGRTAACDDKPRNGTTLAADTKNGCGCSVPGTGGNEHGAWLLLLSVITCAAARSRCARRLPRECPQTPRRHEPPRCA